MNKKIQKRKPMVLTYKKEVTQEKSIEQFNKQLMKAMIALSHREWERLGLDDIMNYEGRKLVWNWFCEHHVKNVLNKEGDPKWS